MSADLSALRKEAPRWPACRLRVLARFYIRSAHCIADVNPVTEHRLFLRLVLCPSGGW